MKRCKPGRLALALSATLSIGLTACSPDMFFGSERDAAVQNAPRYREINYACAGLDLSSSTLSVDDFKKIVGCFNSNGGIQEYADLVEALDEDDLRQIVDFTNTHVLNNKKLLYELERTYYMLADRGILQDTFRQLGRLIENEDFVAAVIALLNETAEPGRDGAKVPPWEVLKTIELVSEKITTGNVELAMEMALALSDSPAFSSLQRHFQGESPANRDLREMVEDLHWYLVGARQPGAFDGGRELIRQLVNGNLFQALDEVLGTTPDRLRTGVPRLSSFLKVSLENDGRRMDEMTDLFHHLNNPIYCLKASKSVPNGIMYAIRELSESTTVEDSARFVKRDNLTTLITMNPFCDYPAELGRYYPSLSGLADYTVSPAGSEGAGFRVIEPSTELIKAFYRVRLPDGSRPLIDLLVSLLSDTQGSSLSGARDDEDSRPKGIKLLIKPLAEVRDRGALDDVLLTLALPTDGGRESLIDALRWIIQERPEFQGRAVYDVVLDEFARASTGNLYNLVSSMKKFVDDERPLIVPSLTALREAYYVNNVHPLIDLVREVMATATSHEDLYGVIFRMSVMPEFRNTIRMVSRMSASPDNELQRLVGSLVTLFHKFAVQGKEREIRERRAPRINLRRLRRHDLSERDLPFSQPELDPLPGYSACDRVRFDLPLDQYDRPGYDEQLSAYLDCLNSDGHHADVRDAVNYLRDQQTSYGGSFFNLQIDLIRNFGTELTTPETGDLADRWIRYYDDGYFNDVLDGLPYWITADVRAGSRGEPGPVLRPLMDLARPLLRVRPALDRLQAFGATVLRREDMPHLLRYAETLADREPEPTPSPDISGAGRPTLARIKRWVFNKECTDFPDRAARAAGRRDPEFETRRAREILREYHDSVTSWDRVDGHPRWEWDKEEFKASLEPLLQKFADPDQNAEGNSAVKASLRILKYFSLRPGQEPNEEQHFTSDHLAQWFHDRANDYQLITYYYPGETKPRVKLVNSLDRLDLVVINADIQFLLPENNSLKFLAIIGEAWGDEPRRIWPRGVKDRYPSCPENPADRRTGGDSRCPQTLNSAIGELLTTLRMFKNLVGLPTRTDCPGQMADPTDPDNVREWETTDPEGVTAGISDRIIPLHVKAGIYNNMMTVPVVIENGPLSSLPARGGMKVLRILFYELFHSSPEKYQKPTAGWANNLNAIIKMVRLGMTRQTGRQLRKMRRNDPALLDFFRSLTEAATLPDSEAILNELIIRDREHRLTWAALDQIFEILDAPGAPRSALRASRRLELDEAGPGGEDDVREQWAREVRRLKQLSFYTFATLAPLGEWATATREARSGRLAAGDPKALIRPMTSSVAAILRRDRQFLTAHADKIETVLRSRAISLFIRALYEDRDRENQKRLGDLLISTLSDPQRGLDALSAVKAIAEDADADRAWNLFSDRLDVMTEMEGYKNLHLEDRLKDVLHFFQEEIDDPANLTPRKIRRYVADRIDPARRGGGDRRTTSDVDEILLLIERDPEAFYRVLTTLSRYIESGELKDFFKLARRSIAEPP